MDVIVDGVRQKGRLASIEPFDETLHVSPPLAMRDSYHASRCPRRFHTGSPHRAAAASLKSDHESFERYGGSDFADMALAMGVLQQNGCTRHKLSRIAEACGHAN